MVRQQVVGSDEELAQQNHREYHSHNAQRIRHGTSKSGTAARHVGIGKGLLCGAKSRSVGCGSAEDAYHVGHAYGQHKAERESHHRAENYYSHAPYIERHTLLAHHADEVGAHVQSQGIDEERQAERLGEIEHLRVGREVKATSHNTDEKHECHTKRYSLDVHLAEGESYRHDERQHNDGLYCRVNREKTFNPFHFLLYS